VGKRREGGREGGRERERERGNEGTRERGNEGEERRCAQVGKRTVNKAAFVCFKVPVLYRIIYIYIY
jgi:hypothetical protein